MYSLLSDCVGYHLDNSFGETDNAQNSRRTLAQRISTMANALEGKRILLVDDDADILTSMQAALEPTGAVIETANNGNKAVELAEKNLPDLVILDMMLPGRSGFLV